MRFLTLFILSFNWIYSFAQMQELKSFGDNPGNLKCFIYIPKNIDSLLKVPLVVALHGCSQTAEEIAVETGWNKLAEQNGFIVLYPEQKVANNMTRCFNWFMKSDIKFNGESASLKNMIDFAIKTYSVDEKSVFSYGLSAGGAMSSTLLALYPSLFQGGAVLAGGPYGTATNFSQAYKMMQGNDTKYTTSSELASLVSELHDQPMKYPKLVVLFGTADEMVSPTNSKKLILQWIGLAPKQKFSETKSIVGDAKIPRTAYLNEKNEEYIVEYQIPNLGHSLPVDPGSGKEQGGKSGTYATAMGFFSTYFIARDFGLLK